MKLIIEVSGNKELNAEELEDLKENVEEVAGFVYDIKQVID